MFCDSTTVNKNPLLRFHNNSKLYMVDCYFYANNRNETYCCVSCAEMIKLIRPRLPCRYIVLLPFIFISLFTNQWALKG